MSRHKLLWGLGLVGCVGLLAAVASCQTRRLDSQVKAQEGQKVDPMSTDPCKGQARFRGKLPKSVAAVFGKKLNPLNPFDSAAVRNSETPWTDWQFMRGVDGESATAEVLENLQKSDNPFISRIAGALNSAQGKVRSEAGVLVALMSLEFQRLDLLECSLIDTNGTLDTYTPGNLNANKDQVWPSLQFEARPDLANGRSSCTGNDEKFRTLDGTCNDLRNPLMGAKTMRFNRNVNFTAARKHGGPDPALVSRELLQRPNRASKDLSQLSEYRKAPFFNMIAASWIQFMTHDWFSHPRKGKNDDSRPLDIGNGQKAPATLKDTSNIPVSPSGKHQPPESGTFQNQITFWWDASQIYGWDEVTAKRVRDPKDPSKLWLDANGMLPIMSNVLKGTPQENDLHEHEWNQGLAAFTDNWWIGVALLQTAFAREHNRFVTELKKREKITDNEQAYQLGRLYISALIAKIHTIEWTPQLLFNPALESGMEANWHGIVGNRAKDPRTQEVLELRESIGRLVDTFNQNAQPQEGEEGFFTKSQKVSALLQSNFLFAFLAAVPGITTTTSNHFGSPFALPEEFVTVYRLHPLIPDVLEKRKLKNGKVETATEQGYEAVLTERTAQAFADKELTKESIGDWWLTFGSQRTGTLQLNNYPRFMNALRFKQNAPEQQLIDLAALEIARDRERGVPKLNEFRANVGLTPLRSFDDFLDMEVAYRVMKACKDKGIKKYSDFKDSLGTATVQEVMRNDSAACVDPKLKADKDTLAVQLSERDKLKAIYGDINEVDTLVGYFAENTRPHGYALAETQFQIFILNASRRLFSDRFFSTDFDAKHYTQFGIEQIRTRGMRDVLADNFTEGGLNKLLKDASGKFKIANAFDPWTRTRKGFALDWSYDPENLHGGQFE